MLSVFYGILSFVCIVLGCAFLYLGDTPSATFAVALATFCSLGRYGNAEY